MLGHLKRVVQTTMHKNFESDSLFLGSYVQFPGEGGALECNRTERFPFLRISTTSLGKVCISMPWFGIIT